MGSSKLFPWVSLALLHTQRNTATLRVNIKDNHVHLITNIDQLGRMHILVCPIHFRDMDQALHSFFQLNETSIIGQIGYLASQACPFWKTASKIGPGIITHLLETKRNTVTLPIKFQHLDLNLITNINNFTGVLDPFPCHICDMQ